MRDWFSFNEPNMEIIHETPKGRKFDYLRPAVTITYVSDRMYNVPEIEINFDGWYKANVGLWPKSNKIRSNFLRIERTPLPSLASLSSYTDSGFDTVL